MVALKIIETKPFMAHLLKGSLFDTWEGRQMEIRTYTKFSIDCKVNKDFYTQEEFELLHHTSYASWSQLKESVFQIIKGNKTPTEMKIVLAKPITSIEDLDPNLVDGVFINIHFENGGVVITTGTSMKTFTLDKSTDHYWDNCVKDFFQRNGILFEER
ncbi:DUF5721 family protein [Vallitalea okinawensis]|uniref:DUF5721 family protein n=1 Tax=Vallitalea okinawensis TaxID=2078660 RepID=UPI000CFC1405|nr:DUF5721 family protein [Vallitalea okinawensis]